MNKRGRRSSKRHAFKGRRRSKKLRSELSKNAFAVSKRSKRRGKELKNRQGKRKRKYKE